MAAQHDKLRIDNTQALAIDLATFEQMPFQCLGYEAPFFSGLVELIVVAEEDDEALRIQVKRAG